MKKYFLPIVSFSLVAFLMLMLLFKDILFSPASDSFGDSGDMRLNYLFFEWTLHWFFGKVPDGTSGVFDFFIYHPVRDTLALSSNHLGSLPLNVALDFFSDNWFVRGNLWLRVTMFLNTVCASLAFYLFLLRWKNTHPDKFQPIQYELILYSAVIGVAHGFSVPRIHFLAHPQLLPEYLSPFFYYFAYVALSSKTARKERYFAAIFAACCFSWQLYLDIHIALFAVFISTVIMTLRTIWLLSTGRNSQLVLDIKSGFIFAIVATILCMPILLPYLQTTKDYGVRSLAEAHVYSPSWSRLTRPSDLLKLYGFLDRSFGEKSIFPTLYFIPLILLIFNSCILSALSAIRSKQGFLVKTRNTVFSFCYALPIILCLDFMVLRSPTALFFREVIPGLKSIRTTGRMSVVLAAMALITWLAMYLIKKPKIASRIFLNTVFMLALVFHVTETYHMENNRWNMSTNSHLQAAIEKATSPVMFLPYTYVAYDTLDVMQPALLAGKRIGNGYSGFMPHGFWEMMNHQDRGDLNPDDQARFLLENFYNALIVDTRKFQISDTEIKKHSEKIGPYLLISRPVVSDELKSMRLTVQELELKMDHLFNNQKIKRDHKT